MLTVHVVRHARLLGGLEKHSDLRFVRASCDICSNVERNALTSGKDHPVVPWTPSCNPIEHRL